MSLLITVSAVNVSALAPLIPGVKRTRTGIHKRPVVGPVRVQTHGLEGDRVGNTRYHGGADQAVYLYSAEDYAWWSEQLGFACEPGLFGENITIDRWWPDPRLGDRIAVGAVVLELTAPRIPCTTLATRMDDPTFVKRFTQAERPGAYARVITEGVIEAHQTGTVQHANPDCPTIAETNAIWFRTPRDPERLRAMMTAPIASRYRERLAQWIDRRVSRG
jgi:MOSC domain-containing protein YiiM